MTLHFDDVTKKQTSIAAFKGFDRNMSCRGYRYEIGGTYTHDGKVQACKSGFHACETPFDVWSYYGPNDSRFAAVTMHGEIARESDGDSKIAAAKITIDAEITAGAFVEKCVDWIIENTKKKTESGHHAQIGASGNYAKIAASGDSAKIAASGHHAKIGASGDSAKIAASGNNAKIAASGKKSVISSAGRDSWAKGAAGTWISLAEYDGSGRCIGFAVGCIGDNGLKPDTYYRAENGKLVEVI